jgi:NAD(P)-dependent dehydrogenase (short-subunit alcohol dehydrogenase family)
MGASLGFSDLAGKTVVITGGAGVLCSSFAQAFAGVGAQVALLDIDGVAARQSAQDLTSSHGVAAIGIQCDVLSADSLESALATVRESLGPVDILVNGAGGNAPSATTGAEQLTKQTPLAESFYGLDPDGFRRAFDLNLLGTILPCQKLTPDMQERGKGVIVNISSMNAFKPLTRIPAYSAAKAAVSNFTEWLAVHLAPAGIRVNAIAPGFFLTKQLKYLAFDQDGNLTPRYERVLAKTPLGRLGEPDELQGTVLYLASDLSSFVSGVVIAVDGGFNASSGV